MEQNIQVTGCNNCPFRNTYMFGCECALNNNIAKDGEEIISIGEYGHFRTDIPEECPIRLRNNSITVTLNIN